MLVGIPLARLVDLYPRKYVLAGGVTLIGGITALGGLAQSFVQLFMSRMLVGAGGSAHAPGSYSMLADYFPPERVPRAIGFLQLGFIGGNVLGIYLGGLLLTLVSGWPVAHWMGLTIHGWQWVLMMVGAPGFVIAALLLLAKEPPRHGLTALSPEVPMTAVLREIWARRSVYLPLFIGLAFSATEFLGLGVWRPAFLTRTYGWTPEHIGKWLSAVTLVSYLVGAAVGTVFTEGGWPSATRTLTYAPQPYSSPWPRRSRSPRRSCPRGSWRCCAWPWAECAPWPRRYRRTPPSSSSRRTRCAAG